MLGQNYVDKSLPLIQGGERNHDWLQTLYAWSLRPNSSSSSRKVIFAAETFGPALVGSRQVGGSDGTASQASSPLGRGITLHSYR